MQTNNRYTFQNHFPQQKNNWTEELRYSDDICIYLVLIITSLIPNQYTSTNSHITDCTKITNTLVQHYLHFQMPVCSNCQKVRNAEKNQSMLGTKYLPLRQKGTNLQSGGDYLCKSFKLWQLMCCYNYNSSIIYLFSYLQKILIFGTCASNLDCWVTLSID